MKLISLSFFPSAPLLPIASSTLPGPLVICWSESVSNISFRCLCRFPRSFYSTPWSLVSQHPPPWPPYLCEFESFHQTLRLNDQPYEFCFSVLLERFADYFWLLVNWILFSIWNIHAPRWHLKSLRGCFLRFPAVRIACVRIRSGFRVTVIFFGTR